MKMEESKRMGKTKKLSAIALLLCLAVIMGCFLNGTIAKYTTAGEGVDNARVAKWGVALDVNSDVFKIEYEADDRSYTVSAYTVKSSNSDNLIAPGTSGGMTFTISGAPETAVRLAASLGEYESASVTYGETEGEKPKASKDGYYAKVEFREGGKTFKPGEFYGTKLPSGQNRTKVTYYKIGDVIKEAPAEPGTGITYYPVSWSLEKGGSAVVKGNLSDIELYLTSISGDYEPNSAEFKKICGDYNLKWTWAFDNGSETDVLDTVIGNAAADIQTEGYTCKLKEAIDFKISAIQID